MSQESTVPSAFRKVPHNIYSERHQARMAGLQQQQQLQSQPQSQAVPVSAPVQTPQPQVQPQQQPTVPAYDPREEELARLREEREQLLAQQQQFVAQYNDMRQAVLNLTQDRDDLAAYKRDREAQDQLAQQNFDDLGIDPDDARAVTRAAMAAAQPKIDKLQEELEQQRRALAAMQKQNTEDMQTMRRNALNAEIMRAHPDFIELQKTPEYKAFMSQRAGGMSKTWDQVAAEEYMAGNTAFVIDLLNKVKQQRPDVQQVMSVAPVQTASSVSATPTQAAPRLTLAELNSLMQMRRITPDEYREQLKQLRAANLR